MGSLRLVADENFHNDILRGLIRRNPSLDLVRIQDFGLRGITDPDLLEWAAREKRAVLSHDVTTMTAFADQRVLQELPMAGLVLVPQPFAMSLIIEDLLILAECSHPGELDGRQVYLPLR